MSDSVAAAAAEVAAQYPLEAPIRLARFGGGLINQTFLVESGGGARHVLQRLHPVFAAEVHLDIEAITRHLLARGRATPRLLRTREGALWVEAPDGVWRLSSYVEGRSFDRVAGPEMAEAAGRLVADFHGALADCDHVFHSRRAGVHDTRRHLAGLEAALGAQRAHPRQAEVARLADELRRTLDGLPALDGAGLPTRVVHGDLKLSNLLFADEAGRRPLCLIDLDTLARRELPYELGDAWRSWCNPAGEDTPDTRFDLPLFAAAWRGYHALARAWLSPDERALLVSGVLTVTVGLAVRFCTDTLEERYFGWDPARFPSRAAHNWVRAQGQAALARSLLAVRGEAERVIAAG
jgi:Ser/Thr protein kinase RdoA (MazF antagonist)